MSRPDASLMTALDQNGFVWERRFVGCEKLSGLRSALGFADLDPARAGARDLLRRCPEVAEFAASEAVRRLVNSFLGEGAFAVRGLFFDKTLNANWRVAWHQDLAVAVQERRDSPGFGPWSLKDGVHHTHAPAALLERMLAVRLHLDDCHEGNGALRVIPGSHRNGKLDAGAIEEWRRRGLTEICSAQAGDMLLMRPLLLHASSSADSPSHRRVIHLEFAVDELPDGMAWAERIPL